MRNLMTIMVGMVLAMPLFTQCKSGKIEDPIIDPEPPSFNAYITYLKYSKQGMRSNVEIMCELVWEEEENRYKVTYEDYDGSNTVYCDGSIGDDIKTYIVEGKADKYKDYYDPGPRVLDGSTWRFEVKYVSASRKNRLSQCFC